VTPEGSPPRRPLAENARQLLAVLFVAAWVTCVLIEPTPDGPDPEYPLWMLPVDLSSLATLVAAAVLLWRAHRYTAPVGVAAGLLMCLETVLCPGIGHHMIGSFLWVQTALSLFVLFTSAALPRFGLPTRRRPSPAG
jgi:hypothetical protein